MKNNSVILRLLSSFFLMYALVSLNAQKLNHQDLFFIAQLMVQDKIKLKSEEKNEIKIGKLPEKNVSAKNRGETEIIVSEHEEAESEIFAAINPLDSNNIIVAAMRMTKTTGGIFNGFDLTFPIYYTNDFGQTWEESEFNGIPPNFNSAGGGDPVIVFDKEGKAHLFLLLAEEISSTEGKTLMAWATSEDNGKSWTVQPVIDETEVSLILGLATGKFVDKEWAVADNHLSSPHQGNTYFSYTHLDIDFTAINYEIRFKKKNLNEAVFPTTPIILTTDDFSYAQFSNVDVDKDGNVHVIFLGQITGEDVFALFYTGSTDAGETFSNPSKISNVHLPCFPFSIQNLTCDDVEGIAPGRVYPSNHIRAGKSASNDKDNLYVVWSADGIDGKETNGLDVYCTKSIDGGETWETPIIVNDDFEIDPDNDNFYPAVEVTENGSVCIAWYDRRNDANNEKTDYYMAWSNDEGNSFETNLALTSSPSDFSVIGSGNDGLGIGEYITIVTTPNGAMVFWADGRTDNGNIDIYAQYVSVGQELSTGLQENILVSTHFRLDNIYPIPTNNELNLEVFLKKSSLLNLQVFDNLGKLHFSKTENGIPGNQQFVVDTKALATGIYFINVTSEYGHIVRKFMIEK